MFMVMIDPEDGTIVTTWGDNGFAGADALYMNIPYRILQDDDGNFHIFGNSATYPYFVLSEDGTTVLRAMAATTTASDVHYDARWVDDDKNQIIAVGNVRTQSGKSINMIMIDPATSTADESWAGNVSLAGYAKYGTTSIYGVRVQSDDGILLRYVDNAPAPMLRKIISDGSALDTDYGASGEVVLGRHSTNPSHHTLVQDNDELYIISYTYSAPNYTAHFTHYDEDGVVITDTTISPIPTGYYRGINLINDKIILSATNGYYIYSTDLVYEDYIETAGVDSAYFVWDDETTRETVDVPGTDEYWTESDIGWGHLEGETVSILADGVVYPDQVVTDGEIDDTDFADATEVHVGLKYESKLRPMKPLPQPAMMAKKATCKQMGISLHNSDEVTYGVRDEDMKDIDFDNVQWKNKCEIDGLFTGSVAVSVPDGFGINLPLQIITDAPLPCVVRAMIPKVDRGV